MVDTEGKNFAVSHPSFRLLANVTTTVSVIEHRLVLFGSQAILTQFVSQPHTLKLAFSLLDGLLSLTLSLTGMLTVKADLVAVTA